MKTRLNMIERILARVSLALLLVAQSLAMASHANARSADNHLSVNLVVICVDGELRQVSFDGRTNSQYPFAPHCPECITAISKALPTKTEIQSPVLFAVPAVFSVSTADQNNRTNRPKQVNCLGPPLSA